MPLRIPTGLSRFVVQTKRLPYEAIRPLPVLVGLMRDLTRSRDQRISENAPLRQQLVVKRPVFKANERGLIVSLASMVRGWRDAELLETVGALHSHQAVRGILAPR